MIYFGDVHSDVGVRVIGVAVMAKISSCDGCDGCDAMMECLARKMALPDGSGETFYSVMNHDI